MANTRCHCFDTMEILFVPMQSLPDAVATRCPMPDAAQAKTNKTNKALF